MSEEKIKILQGIYKNVINKKWGCLHPNCENPAINSHLLQKNGVLNQISEKSHLYELVQNDYFKIYKGEKTLIFKRNSINNILSHPLFCNYHDTLLFRVIEKSDIDFNQIHSQTLFSYRALCGELWKKYRNLEFYNRLANSNGLKLLLSNHEKLTNKTLIESHTLGISDLLKYKNILEDINQIPNKFTFVTYRVPKLDICGSGVFSPISNNEFPYQENPFPTVFINIVPFNDHLYIILGRSLEFTNHWIDKYFKEWESNYLEKYELLISDLLATRIESWAISPSLFEKWKPFKLGKMEEYWNNNKFNMYVNQSFGINLFS